MLLRHQARLRTQAQSVSSKAGGVVGGPVWFGFNRRLQCVIQVCLPQPEQVPPSPLRAEAEIAGMVQYTPGAWPSLSPHSSRKDLGQSGKDGATMAVYTKGHPSRSCFPDEGPMKM